ncbi:uncharacterized protein LOC113351801 [Papaver somniferum]|uniref:uncharacterized protein LOC113351801 n=1 Tax=Papaver somniferum TaxID=3469 RepID=UPI000E701CDD|nr:uncharacterized protein LOC113351801 [Papaver somniferum]
MPHLNTAIDKIWEAVILMEDIPEPPNMGHEPPPGRRSREFCAYHCFHGHTTSNCRNVQKIILRMIDQGKLNHFLIPQQQNLPPPLEEQASGMKTRKKTYLIEVGAKAKNLYRNSILHSFRSIKDFHDNVLSRVYARDNDGKEILNLEKISPLKDWQRQPILFNAEEALGGGEMHESPLLVKPEINPKAKTDEEEDDDADAWAINMILIDPGSSVDILFYHTYKTMGKRDDELIPSTYKIYGFNGSVNKPKGEITMWIPLKSITKEIVFCIVDVESPYNALIGRPWIHNILGVASTFHQCIKFPLPQGVGIIRGDPIEGKTVMRLMSMKVKNARISEETGKRRYEKESDVKD